MSSIILKRAGEMAKGIIIAMTLFIMIGGVTPTVFAAYEDSLKGYWKMDEFNRNDNFGGTSLNAERWSPLSISGSYAVNDDLTLSGNNSQIAGNLFLAGDFDVQVDYSAVQWGGNSGSKSISLIMMNSAGDKFLYSVRGHNDSSNYYTRMDCVNGIWYCDSTVSTSDTSGKLRITRSGSTFTAYEWTGSAWTTLSPPSPSQSFSDPANIRLVSWSNDAAISAHFDNVKVANEPVADAKGVNGGIANGATSVAGKTGFGNALNFNGTNDYVQVANESNFDFDRANAFSAGTWVKTTGNGANNQVLISKLVTAASYAGYQMTMMTDGTISAYLISDWGTSNYLYETTTAGGYNDGNWHYVSMTYDGSSSANGLKIYVDEVEKTTASYGSLTGSILNDAPLRLGTQRAEACFLKGSLDDSSIWSRTLSSEEIKSIYRFGTEAYESNIGTWNSTGTTDWATGWSATGAPTALKDAYVNSGTALVSTAGDIAKDLYVGYETGDSGAVSITTGDLTAANEYIGRTGTGSVTQTGGTNTIADTLYIGQNDGSTGTYNLQGGILKAHAVTLGSGASAFNFTGGTLKTYSFTGDLVIGDNAVIAPGSSPGIMDVYGEFVLNGTYQAELGGLTPGTEYDQIVVHGGNITLGSDSIIELAQWNSFVPEVGDSFILMDWDEGYTFTDNGYEFDPGVYGLPGDWVLSVNGTQFEAKYVGAVPEPGCAFGLLLGFFVPGFKRLLKRRSKGHGVKGR